MFKKESDNDKMRAFIDGMMKDAFDAGFSAGWDAALKALMGCIVKNETKTEESKLQWESMTNGRSTGTSEEN